MLEYFRPFWILKAESASDTLQPISSLMLTHTHIIRIRSPINLIYANTAHRLSPFDAVYDHRLGLLDVELSRSQEPSGVKNMNS
jgi:hypothetical protein